MKIKTFNGKRCEEERRVHGAVCVQCAGRCICRATANGEDAANRPVRDSPNG